MRKYIWFLLGLLVSLLVSTPSFANYIPDDPVCGSLWNFSGIGFGADTGDYPTQLYDWNGESAWFLAEKVHYDGSPLIYCDADPLDVEGSDANGPFRVHINPTTATGGGCSTSNGSGDAYRAYWYKLRPTTAQCDYLQPLEPVNCSSGVMDEDETGIDCGGACLASCELVCADGLPPIEEVGSPWEGKCYGGIFATINGVCPPNTVLGVSGSCVGIDDPISMSTEFTEGEISSMGIPPTDYAFEHQTVFTDQTDSWVSVDNGDGTSTNTTTTTTSSNVDGSSTTTSTETTTRTDIVNNATNQIISSTISTVKDAPATENIGNYDLGQMSEGDLDFDISADLPDVVNDDGSFFSNIIDGMPFFAILDTFEIQATSFECSVQMVDVFGTDLEITICPWETHLRAVGAILLAIAQLYAFVIVYKGWK